MKYGVCRDLCLYSKCFPMNPAQALTLNFIFWYKGKSVKAHSNTPPRKLRDHVFGTQEDSSLIPKETDKQTADALKPLLAFLEEHADCVQAFSARRSEKYVPVDQSTTASCLLTCSA